MMADMVMRNGRIYTMDEGFTVAEAIAIKDGEILWTGDGADAGRFISKDTKVVDLGGKTVLPGLIDMHVHVPGNAYNALHNIDVYDAKTAEETEEIIRDFIKTHPEKDVYYGKGFKTALFPGDEKIKGPRKERLDAICSDKPIGIIDEGGHVIWLNSKGLEEAGITGTTEDIPGGVIEKDAQGNLWGILKDEAKKLFKEQQFSREEKIQAYQWFQDLMNSYGYTTVLAMRQSASSDPVPIFDIMRYFEDGDKLSLRIDGAREIKAVENKLSQIDDLERTRRDLSTAGSCIRATTAKFFLDGTVEGLSAFLKEPYCVEKDGEPYRGELLWDSVELTETFEEVLRRGFNIHIHGVGDGAVTVAVEALERAQCAVAGDHRNCITHLQLVEDDDIRKMGELGMVACVNTYWHLKDPSIYFDSEEVLLGEERAAREYPLKKFIDNGVLVTCSADYPSSPDPNPFFAIQAGVTRNLYDADYFGVGAIDDEDDPRWLLGPEERVSVEDMVRAYTSNAAFAMHREQEIGTLEPGKKADMIIIDRDIFAIDHLDIEKTKVLETIFDGRVVYKA